LAFFIAVAPALAAEEKPALKAADARTQRLYDQVVKLHRRFAGQKKYPSEPFKSLLTEVSLYHDDELASYLSDMGAEGTRSAPVHFAPWAQQRLALMSMQQGAYAEAVIQFRELGERFAGAQVIEPADGEWASVEKSEAAALRGEIEAALALAAQEGGKKVSDA